jgi:hypothetical protein
MDHLRLMHASDVRSWRAARSFEIRHGRFLFSVAQGNGFTGILELGSSEHARFAVMGTAESVTEQTKLDQGSSILCLQFRRRCRPHVTRDEC